MDNCSLSAHSVVQHIANTYMYLASLSLRHMMCMYAEYAQSSAHTVRYNIISHKRTYKYIMTFNPLNDAHPLLILT